jgi:cysteine desulfurase
MRVYLDWNATTPPLPEALAAMARASTEAWGNPSSVHADGRAARRPVEHAREAIAALAGCDARDVVLTSGGTEANNLAIVSAFDERSSEAPWLLTNRLEHPSVTRVAEALEREGHARVRWIAVTPEGMVDLDDLRRGLDHEPAGLVTLQVVNHETGVVQPVDDVVRLTRERGVRLHLDAVQAWGKVRFDSSAGDTRSLAGHKLRGPKGVGALVARLGVGLAPILRGGAQERGLRPGTVDGVACAGLAVAAEYAVSGAARYTQVAGLRDRLERELLALWPSARVNGVGLRAPHVTNIAFEGAAGPELVAALDLEGVSVSSGSACSAGTTDPSPVITVMRGAARAASSVRLSLGDTTTDEDVELAVTAFARVLARVR